VETVSVEDADPPVVKVLLVGDRDAVGPATGMIVERVTLPVKLFRLVRVTEEVVEEPGCMVIVVGLAVVEKSAPTVTDTVAL